MNIKKISVPTDFSENSLKALESACHTARKFSAEVDLIHFIAAPVGHFVSSGTYETSFEDKLFVMKAIEKASSKLKVIKDDVKFVGVRINTIVKVINDESDFSKDSAFQGADLIVMSTEGDHSSFKIFGDTNAMDVAFKANCPVLTIKEGLVIEKVRTLVLPTDFKSENIEFISFVKYLQEMYDFKLHIIYINSLIGGLHDKKEVEGAMKAFVKRYNLKNFEFKFIPDLTSYTGIVNYAEEVNADIIALHTHSGKGFFHWGGGVSGDLIRYSSTPVLTCRLT
ncbi:MAG: universal stress protein [Cytophagaceae bacterium]